MSNVGTKYLLKYWSNYWSKSITDCIDYCIDTWDSPMDWQYSLASCCSKSLHPNFQVTTNPFPFQKWLGAWAAHLAVPPTILETSM